MDTEDLSTDLLRERLPKPIGHSEKKQREKTAISLNELLKFGVPANPIRCSEIRYSEKKQRGEAVKKISSDGSLKELMQCLPNTISDSGRADLFAEIARDEYKLTGRKLTFPIALNFIEEAKYYAKDQTKRSHVKALFNFIQSHHCYHG